MRGRSRDQVKWGCGRPCSLAADFQCRFVFIGIALPNPAPPIRPARALRASRAGHIPATPVVRNLPHPHGNKRTPRFAWRSAHRGALIERRKRRPASIGAGAVLQVAVRGWLVRGPQPRWPAAAKAVAIRPAELSLRTTLYFGGGCQVSLPMSDPTFSIMAKRKAVVSPKSSHPFSASIAPMSCQWDSRDIFACP